MNLFYCAKCGKYEEKFQFDERKDRDKVTFQNIRDGYGMAITHIVCPQCGYLLGGFMRYFEDSEDTKWYLKDTIKLYSEPNIKGYWDNEDREKIIEMIKTRIKRKETK